MHNPKIIPVILSGGIGSRLWPLSRDTYPKQYIKIKHNSNRSLIQQTYQRLSKIKNLDKPIIVCNKNHRFIVAEQFREINVETNTILLEPFARGTAAAIALAALKAKEDQDNPYLLVVSCDHEILDEENFINSINEAIKHAKNNKLVTFGIIPNRPEIGYGYIEADKPLDETIVEGANIVRFIEKPNLDMAQKLISNECILWNSGIFLFKTNSILKEIEKFEPLILKQCSEAMKLKSFDLDFLRIDESSFDRCPNLSIDKSIMQKTNLGFVVSLDAGWRDIGSWDVVWEVSKKDKEGNVSKGKVLIKDSKDSLIRSENRLIVGLGIKDLIIVETSDAVLVCNKKYAQKIKNIVQELNTNNIYEGSNHYKSYRPWGSYESIAQDLNWKVKKLVVNPNQSLSLQMHNYRSEHWVVVSGVAKIQLDEKVFYLEENQSTYIPKNSKHRLTNPSNKILIVVEIQSGDYLQEDDIKRLEDQYGRLEND